MHCELDDKKRDKIYNNKPLIQKNPIVFFIETSFSVISLLLFRLIYELFSIHKFHKGTFRGRLLLLMQIKSLFEH